MQNSGPMEDRLLIRELYGLYADSSSRMSKADWLACWTEDARWTSHLFDCSGKAELDAQWEIILGPVASMGFFSEIGPIAVTGETATARSSAREILQLKDGGVFKLVGAYEDQLRREGGQWLFAQRDYRVLVQELPG